MLDARDSDSGQLDEAVELLTRGGRDIRHAIAMLVPEAWEGARDLDPEVRGFYRYHAALDGAVGRPGRADLHRRPRRRRRARPQRSAPAALRHLRGRLRRVLLRGGRGRRARARHGRPRPARARRDALRGSRAAASSSTTTARSAWPPARPTPTGRPTASGRCRATGRSRRRRAGGPRGPPGGPRLHGRGAAHGPEADGRRRQGARLLDGRRLAAAVLAGAAPARPPLPAPTLRPGHEPADRPPPRALGDEPAHPARAAAAAAQRDGRSGAPRAAVVVLPLPVDRRAPRATTTPFDLAELDATFPVTDGPAGCGPRSSGCRRPRWRSPPRAPSCSSSTTAPSASAGAPIPSLLVTGAVHHRSSLRPARPGRPRRLADDVRDTHHVACLLGYGADAICPRLALETVARRGRRGRHRAASPEAQEHFQAAIEDGVLKILSKMGISTVDSYRGAQIFEVIGLADEVVDLCFTGRAVDGRRDRLGRARRGRPRPCTRRPSSTEPRLLPGPQGRRARPRPHQGGRRRAGRCVERRARSTTWPPPTCSSGPSPASRYDAYEAFARAGRRPPPTELHDLLELVAARPADPARRGRARDGDRPRFSTGAMSHGSLSKEAHETLARGHEPHRRRVQLRRGRRGPVPLPHAGHGRDDKNCRIKQIASGRFGVTPEYLRPRRRAPDQDGPGLQARRGRPAARATRCPEEIARLRHTQPGVGAHLAAAAPRHLLHRGPGPAHLRPQAGQPRAEVSVKLVAENGVGTIAAGVVKALADVVHDLGRQRRHRRQPAVVDQARRACPGSSAWPTPSGRSSTTACAAASASASTAGSRPDAT